MANIPIISYLISMLIYNLVNTICYSCLNGMHLTNMTLLSVFILNQTVFNYKKDHIYPTNKYSKKDALILHKDQVP